MNRYRMVIVLICSILQRSLGQNLIIDDDFVTVNVTEEEVTADEQPILNSFRSLFDPSSSYISETSDESVVVYDSDVGDYIITTSPLWVSNGRETICVGYLEGPTAVDIMLKNSYSWNSVFSMSHSQRFPEGGSGCFEVQVPELSGYSLSVTLTARIQTATAVTEKSVQIRIYGEKLETYIQTDKPKYKPGQEVKFRMLSIKSPSMKVVREDISIVWIEAPNGLRIMQWTDVKADEGLIDLQMQLSDEPMLGRWTIKARVDGRTVTQTFVVEEYVLPKFEVLTETPSAIYIRDETFKIKICGLYTYGQPVRGSVNATICFKYTWSECSPETTVVKYADDTGLDGCGEFDLTSEELKWDISQYYYSDRRLSIDANFTEAGTDVTLRGSSLSTSIKNTAVNIEIGGLGYYKPGFEYSGKVIVTNADGSPADGINMTIAIRERHDSVDIHTFNLISYKGAVEFSFDGPTDTSIATLYIKVIAEGYETDSTYDDYFGYYWIRHNPYNTKTLTAFYSPSGSFLNLKPVTNELSFGSVHTFDVEYTVPTGDSVEIDVKYIVIARGAVAASGSLVLKTQSCSHEGKRDIIPWPNYSYDYYADLPSTPEKEELVVGLEPLPATCRFSFSLPIDIVAEMSPDANLLVYYARKDDEVVSDSIQFRVVKGLSNQVSLNFEDEETRPGETTTLTVQSEANSLCAVGVVDKSVELLGTTNQLTNDKVFNSLSTYSRGYFYYPLNACSRSRFDGIRQAPDDGPPKPAPTRAGYTLRTNTYTTTKHADAVTVFRNAGVAFMTNLDVETRPCYEITSYFWRRDYDYWYHNPRGPSIRADDMFDSPQEIGDIVLDEIPVAVAIVDEAADEEEDETVDEEEDPPVKIRTYFPETLLWQLKRTRQEDGTAEFNLNVPDTITDWKANGFCISPDSDIGISETATLRAFKPFFVSLTLPYSVIRNETVPLKITVFNYLPTKCLMVKLVLKRSTNFTTLGNDFTRKVCVCGGASKTVRFRIVPHQLGDVPITVSAVTKGFNAATSSRMCDGSEHEAADRQYVGLTDGVQRDLLVEPEGIEKDVTQSSIICLSHNEEEKFSYNVDLPANTVPGSARVKLQVIGDIMGPALNNLNHLIRLPTGCGEQNIVKMAPNIYVLQYLINTGQIDDQLKQTIVRNIQAGYHRELNYRRRDGSYSAFGNSDNDGSTWLTAFVLRSFAESGEFINIDSDLMMDSLDWLTNQQNTTTGCVKSRGRLFNKAMKGGVSDEITLTAYTLMTIIEAGGRSAENFISKASICLVNRWNAVDSGIRNDPYSVALLAYAFKLSHHDLYVEVLDQLNELAIEEDGLKHWERPESLRPTNPCYYCRAPSAEVEMTAYALLALNLEIDDEQIEGLKISRWLAQQQNAYGGYSSTQDTVIALKALSYFAEVIYGGETTEMNVRASASAGGEVQEFQIDSSNRLLVQRMDIEKAPTTVDVETSGGGCILIQIQSLYNIYEKPAVEVEPFSIDVVTSTPVEKLKCERQTMRITVSYNGNDGASSMAIVEVKLISGYYADKHSLEKLSKDTELNTLGFKRYESKGNTVDLYFDEFTAEPISFEFDVVQEINVKNSKPGMITVYDYYEAGVMLYTNTTPVMPIGFAMSIVIQCVIVTVLYLI